MTGGGGEIVYRGVALFCSVLFQKIPPLTFRSTLRYNIPGKYAEPLITPVNVLQENTLYMQIPYTTV